MPLLLFVEFSKRRRKPKNFLSILFPLRGGGVGGGAAEKMQGNFRFAPPERSGGGRGASGRSDRTIWVKATTRSARALCPSVAFGEGGKSELISNKILDFARAERVVA
jgi:hypothetical protein